jgi:Asp-tRNA(Asn)/Glu-tRNA(Gln) amidotransferase A subunit family amidase
MTATRSPVTVSEARARIAELGHLNAFISLSDEQGDGPAVAIKDLVDVAGLTTTGGGRILPDVPAVRDATVVRHVRQHGCVVVGKTNLHEWAYGSTNFNAHFGVARNPVDPERVSGGSSGGSAVAVATRMCEWAIGTDTAGSLRIPASLCGVVSIKPTYGTVATAGVIPLSKSLDTVGPIARDVDGAAAALAQMTLAPLPSPGAPRRLAELRVGRPGGNWVEGLDEQTAAVWESVCGTFPEIAIPPRAEATAICTTISMYEASQFHRGWVEQHPDRYGDQDVLNRLRAGLEIPEADYRLAIRSRSALSREMAAAMSGWDALLAPATALVAPRVDDRDVREPMTRFTRPFSATGQPVVTIPAPTSGLPVGIQVVGHPQQEAALISVARTLEAHWG